MRLATIISLGASFALGLGALIIAMVWLPSVDEKEEKVELTPVVVATTPITFGTRLDKKNLSVVRMPVNAVPVGAYRAVTDVLTLDGGAPVALVSMAPREAVLPAKLSGGGARFSVSSMITRGMRAYTIRASDVAGGGGHILPGDRVDVLLSRRIGGEGAGTARADVVLQNVRVLGINMNADQSSTDKASPKSATLEVTMEDAARLSIAADVGTLSLVLRRAGSAEIEPLHTVSMVIAPAAGRRPPAETPAPPAARATPAVPSTPKADVLMILNGNQRSVPESEAGA